MYTADTFMQSHAKKTNVKWAEENLGHPTGSMGRATVIVDLGKSFSSNQVFSVNIENYKQQSTNLQCLVN